MNNTVQEIDITKKAFGDIFILQSYTKFFSFKHYLVFKCKEKQINFWQKVADLRCFFPWYHRGHTRITIEKSICNAPECTVIIIFLWPFHVLLWEIFHVMYWRYISRIKLKGIFLKQKKLTFLSKMIRSKNHSNGHCWSF